MKKVKTNWKYEFWKEYQKILDRNLEMKMEAVRQASRDGVLKEVLKFI